MAPWVDGQDWVNGDRMTEQRLDQMQGNADYLRDEVGRRLVAQSTYMVKLNQSGVTYYWARLRLDIGGNSFTSGWMENELTYPQAWKPIDGIPRNELLSGLSLDTVYDLDIYVEIGVTQGSASPVVMGRATVYNVEDIGGYLSAFGEFQWFAPSGVAFRNFTVLLTRDDEAL